MAGSIVSSITKQPVKGLGIVRAKAAITVTAGGVASPTVIGSFFGRIVRVIYDADTLDTNSVVTVADADSGASLLVLTHPGTSDLNFRPTSNITDNTGTAVTAATTAPDVNRDIFVAGKVSVGVTGGGTSTSGAITLVIEQP